MAAAQAKAAEVLRSLKEKTGVTEDVKLIGAVHIVTMFFFFLALVLDWYSFANGQFQSNLFESGISDAIAAFVLITFLACLGVFGLLWQSNKKAQERDAVAASQFIKFSAITLGCSGFLFFILCCAAMDIKECAQFCVSFAAGTAMGFLFTVPLLAFNAFLCVGALAGDAQEQSAKSGGREMNAYQNQV